MSETETPPISGQVSPPISGAEPIHDWELRPWILAALLAITGLIIHLVTDSGDDTPLRAGIAAFAFFGAASLAFTIDRDRYVAPAIFAGIVAIAMFGLAWRVTEADNYSADEAFWFAAGVVAVVLAIPLFQAGFWRDRLNTSYRATHFFVWTDAITAAGALAFTGLSWALLAILSELFQLLQIDLIEDLMREDWFGWTFSGAAFGAAFGVLRNQIKILGTLQNVVMLVLSILAIPLAAALVLFLLAMIVSGPQVLWNATDSATPILLACAVGAFVLSNAVVRDVDAEMSGNRVTRIAALVLAVLIFPLAVFAAISMGTRIAQHGLSPERIWGLIAITVAVIYGAAYLISVLRGRKDGAWRDLLRQANLHMALLVCGAAIILALPIFDFGAVSTRDQVARLESGEVSAEDFDFDALRWDFGEAGRAALAKLTKNPNTEIAALAKEAQELGSRYDRYERRNNERYANAEENIRLVEEDTLIRAKLERYVRDNPWQCETACVLIEVEDDRDELRHFKLVSTRRVEPLLINIEGQFQNEQRRDWNEQITPVEADSAVEVRPYEGRRVYVDGKPVGAPFD